MSHELAAMAARLQREVPNAETSIDDALIAVASLTSSVVTARRVTGLPPKTGQRTIIRLVKAQMSLVEVGGSILRAHDELADIGKETAGYDLRECPVSATTDVVPLSSAA